MATKGFDIDKMLKGIKNDIEKDLKRHPEQVLNNHIGEPLDSPCPRCGESKLIILRGAKAKCSACSRIIKIDVDVNWSK